MKKQREAKSRREAEAVEVRRKADIEALAAAQKLRNGLDSLKVNGYGSINDFLTAFYITTDPHLSSTATKLNDKHRPAIWRPWRTARPSSFASGLSTRS